MTREEKAIVIDELKEKFSNVDNFYVVDASGLTVAQINEFRRLCFQKGVEYKVYKNTLIKKALDNLESDYSELYEQALKGSSGILFSPEAGNLPAKIIKDYRKKGFSEDRPLLKGAYIQSDVYLGEEKLNELSKLKSKEELIGEVITLLQSPMKNVIAALESGKSQLSGIVKTLSEREEKE